MGRRDEKGLIRSSIAIQRKNEQGRRQARGGGCELYPVVRSGNGLLVWIVWLGSSLVPTVANRNARELDELRGRKSVRFRMIREHVPIGKPRIRLLKGDDLQSRSR